MDSYTKYSKIRDQRGFKDSQVCKLTGIAPSVISDWKARSKKNPNANLSFRNARLIAEALETTVGSFLN